ncbi:exodeoxyribonuclease III [Salinibius halmophilus]|uniref:exodeoxyribonuclease III n=1 Tax=Salinibius halmophilus TaxID=1853216 RepID=UPI000E673336|nr:exodeoxyribonuclease III [Salinibius halmophilus]
MKIASLNLNGFDNALVNGFEQWLAQQDADIICLQDIREQEYKLPKAVLEPKGYEAYFFESDPADLGGVAIFTQVLPKAIIRGIGSFDVDQEGSFIQADFGGFSVASMLFPHGFEQASAERKAVYLERFMHHFKRTQRKRRNYIFAGSLYMAHQTIDVKAWQQAQDIAGFLPEERAWMDQLFGPLGFSDAMREVEPSEDQFSWQQGARAARFDYQICTPDIAETVLDAYFDEEAGLSEHHPLIVTYDLELY